MIENKYLNIDGLNKLVANITSHFAKAKHAHTKSEITDFPTIPTKTSELINDSGFANAKITMVRW